MHKYFFLRPIRGTEPRARSHQHSPWQREAVAAIAFEPEIDAHSLDPGGERGRIDLGQVLGAEIALQQVFHLHSTALADRADRLEQFQLRFGFHTGRDISLVLPFTEGAT